MKVGKRLAEIEGLGFSIDLERLFELRSPNDTWSASISFSRMDYKYSATCHANVERWWDGNENMKTGAFKSFEEALDWCVKEMADK